MVYMSDGVLIGYMDGRKDGGKSVDSGSTGDTVKQVMSPLKKGKKIVIDGILEPVKTYDNIRKCTSRT